MGGVETTYPEESAVRNLPTVVVIPCSGEKAPEPMPAQDLYTGSMFRHTLTAAKAEGFGTILILSALHGLVELDQVIEPYDVRMGQPGSVTADTLAAQVEARFGEDDVDLYFMLPQAYLVVADEAFRRSYQYGQVVYEACGGIGDQRRVNRNVRELAERMDAVA